MRRKGLVVAVLLLGILEFGCTHTSPHSLVLTPNAAFLKDYSVEKKGRTCEVDVFCLLPLGSNGLRGALENMEPAPDGMTLDHVVVDTKTHFYLLWCKRCTEVFARYVPSSEEGALAGLANGTADSVDDDVVIRGLAAVASAPPDWPTICERFVSNLAIAEVEKRDAHVMACQSMCREKPNGRFARCLTSAEHPADYRRCTAFW